ncbi:proprotein convertase P-domain-containing protein [Nonomuraea africana]|uniref:LasA protease n=1 Tax=Nonomuraea africana TaxID=46171 RepID=A0ABR9K663_9ACTN|nr:proprotein convertase P-domain-containing protein [Nonomuraea africana]MBE1557512.1 LasA protease [Nonomuraea africana]
MRHPTRLMAILFLLMAGLATTTPQAANAQAATLQEAVIAAMTETSQSAGSSLAAAGAGFEVNIQRQAPGWAFGSGVIKAPAEEGAHPEGWMFLARLTYGSWTAALDGTAAFADLATAAPEGVVSLGEKQTFASNARQQSQSLAATVDTGLGLPWRQGASWLLIGGPHGWSGSPRPWSSLDFDSRAANRDVLAASPGRAYWVCSNGGHIRIIHDNGYTTEYYHLLNEIKPNGERVNTGDYLGMTSTRVPCGGSAGSNHVHFSVRESGQFISLEGRTVGGWTWHEGGAAYGGYATRGTERRNVGTYLVNYGPSGGPGEPKVFENQQNWNIPDLSWAESYITVSGVGGNAPANLQIYADVHHGWRGDLRLRLIAPDGRSYLLRTPDPDDNGTVIHEIYTRDASATRADGRWILRAEDVDANHSGYIDAWRLTFPAS